MKNSRPHLTVAPQARILISGKRVAMCTTSITSRIVALAPLLIAVCGSVLRDPGVLFCHGSIGSVSAFSVGFSGAGIGG